MQGPSVTSSQFDKTSISGSGNQNLNIVGNNMFQLPTWAKDCNAMNLPNPSTPEALGKHAI